MKYLWIFIFLSSFLWAKPLEINVKAPSAILVNAKNHKILFAKDAYSPYFPASITKIATVLYVLDREHFDITATAVASKNALTYVYPKQKIESKYALPAYWLETDGSTFGLKPWENISIESLLYATMLRSGNDAANVLAENIGGSIGDFMSGLNQYVHNMGCASTHFENPHGLHHPSHQTTAFDMSLIAAKALRLPLFCTIVSSDSFVAPATNKNEAKTIRQFNELLKKGRYHYPPAIGIKTGYHMLAQHNLVAAAKNEERVLIAVLLKEEKRDDCYQDAIALFNKAFSEQKKDKIVFPSTKEYTIKISGAADLLHVSPSQDVAFSYFPSEKPIVSACIEWGNLALPIQKGQEIGKISVLDESNNVLVTTPLIAQNALDRGFMAKIMHFFTNFSKK